MMRKATIWLLMAIMPMLAKAGTKADSVTYVKDIAPIIQSKCVSCHHPKGVGSMPLITYKEVVSHASMVAHTTEKHIMPPWRADLTKNNFVNQRPITQAEIDKIKLWVDNGTPYGDTAVPEPKAHYKEYVQIGKPDIVLHYNQAFKMPAGKDDINVTYYFPLNNDTALYVSAYEYMPDNRKIVHHSWIFLEQDSNLTKFKGKKRGDLLTEQTNEFDIDMTCFYYHNLAYTPGNFPHAYPNGFAERLKPHTVIILQVHYNGSGKAETDSSVLNIYTSKKPPKHRVESLLMTEGFIQNPPFSIKPGGVKTFHMAYKGMPADITLLRISPHMHLHGKVVQAYAVTPNNDTINLLSINDWDFNWQGIYTYTKPIIIPKHSRIYMDATMDNTDSNPNNPYHPPKRMKWGVRSKDEMCQMMLYYSEYKKGDEDIVYKEQQ